MPYDTRNDCALVRLHQRSILITSRAHLVDNFTEDDADSSVVVQEHGFAGCLSEDIMERRADESERLSYCITDKVACQSIASPDDMGAMLLEYKAGAAENSCAQLWKYSAGLRPDCRQGMLTRELVILPSP